MREAEMREGRKKDMGHERIGVFAKISIMESHYRSISSI
jgi:hypothetical protein